MPQKVQIPDDLGTVAVIGGCGLVGHHIVGLLLDESRKSKVVVVDLKTTTNRLSGAEYHDCDITNAARVQEVFEKIKPDVVIHTAAALATLPKNKRDLIWKVNVDGTNNVLKAAQDNGTKAFIYTSSGSVITAGADMYLNRDESWPVIIGDQQPDHYANTKVMSLVFREALYN